MRPLKMRSVVEVDDNHLRATIEADPLTTTWKLPNNSTPTILRSFSIWSKLERWKSSISGCLMSWLKIKKTIIIFKCHLLLFYTITMNHFSIGLWDATKSGFYTTITDAQLSGWTEKKLQSTSQSQTCTKKKRSWSLFGGLLPVWSTTAFWILAKPLPLRSMLSKLKRCFKTCRTCSWHWQQNEPNSAAW